MAQIKIISNPYTREISYQSFNEISGEWEDIQIKNPNSRLREDESERAFLPFKIKEIVEIIISEYSDSNNPIEINFEGTQDEYQEVEDICRDDNYKNMIELIRSPKYLENGRLILKETKETFEKVQPIIKEIVKDDASIIENLNKVSDALKDIIPICVFGNYSSGKSTLINALIGSEILPSGGDPVTAKIYKISRSLQPDYASIDFEYLSEHVSLIFEGDSYRVRSGNANSDLMTEVLDTISKCKVATLEARVNAALVIINGFEKRDKNNTVLGSIIELMVPFSKNIGIIGQSYNNFVIFDTPGSNSASNVDHGKVLEEALKGFSNGIPVWVATYETIDTNDNAELCERALTFKALDKRFTMIIMNKSDGADLPEEGFDGEQIQNIREYTAVEKMYSGGIYFVSSIMGLGAKKGGELTDKHYRKTYRAQQEMYSDPEDMDYMSLYKYNIMPDQIKVKAVQYSEKCNDMIFANSGLLCMEMEMENFASRHSAYNKCQMVYMFLNDVIDETNRRIEEKTNRLKGMLEKRNSELDSEKQALIHDIQSQIEMLESDFKDGSKVHFKDFAERDIDFSHSKEEVERVDEKIWTKFSDENNLASHEKNYEDSMSNMWKHFKTNGQSLFKGNFIDSLKTMGNDLMSDLKEVQETWELKETSTKEVDKQTSDKLIHAVAKEYKKKLGASKDLISTELRRYWNERTEDLRKQITEIVTESDSLSENQRKELATIIMNYKPMEFNDDTESIFIKKKFLRGSFLGISFIESERIDIRRITAIYNDKLKKNTKEMAIDMNHEWYESFKTWDQSLFAYIEMHITELNPNLKDMAELIQDDTEKILKLESNQQSISDALLAINELLSWKEPELSEE